MYVISFLIPDWMEGQEVAVELGPKTTGLQGTCSGATNAFVDHGTGTLRFRLSVQTEGNMANRVGCQMIGEYEDAVIIYHGTHCYLSPPPPPHVHTTCQHADSFQFWSYEERAESWKGVLHVSPWEAGLVVRLDFGGRPFQVSTVQYASKGECTSTFCDFVLGQTGLMDTVNGAFGQVEINAGGRFEFTALGERPNNDGTNIQPKITCDNGVRRTRATVASTTDRSRSGGSQRSI